MTERAGNSARMKRANRCLLLRTLRDDPCSRAELSRKTGLTRAGVSLIIDPLIDSGMVAEAGIGEAAQGRKPVLLRIVPSARYALGVNLARGCCTVGITDLSGCITAEQKADLSGVESANQAMERIVDILDALIAKNDISPKKLVGLGITAPGPLLARDGVILDPPNFPLWKNIAVAEFFKAHYQLPVLLENNSRALAQAERAYGAGKNISDFILLTVDTGVGAGIVLQGELFSGGGGVGGEIGHTCINPHGKRCACGNNGCLELYAAIPNLLRETKPLPCTAGWEEVADAAEGGNTACIQAVEREADYLAAGLINAVNLFAPSAIVLAGDVAYRPAQLLKLLDARINSAVITRRYSSVRLIASELRDKTGILSAANLALDSFFSDESAHV